jgi:hypothetical protein
VYLDNVADPCSGCSSVVDVFPHLRCVVASLCILGGVLLFFRQMAPYQYNDWSQSFVVSTVCDLGHTTSLCNPCPQWTEMRSFESDLSLCPRRLCGCVVLFLPANHNIHRPGSITCDIQCGRGPVHCSISLLYFTALFHCSIVLPYSLPYSLPYALPATNYCFSIALSRLFHLQPMPSPHSLPIIKSSVLNCF